MTIIPCDIYGCRNAALPGKETTAEIDGDTVNLELCDEHFAFFEATNPDKYSIGYTFTQRVEVRLHPAKSTTP